jgi:hypothetical protein
LGKNFGVELMTGVVVHTTGLTAITG